MALFLAHTVLLLGASYAAARSLARPLLDRLLATFLLAWGNLVATSLLLAGLHHLGEAVWFFRTSLILACATWLLLRRLQPAPAGPAQLAPEDRPGLWLLVGFVATLLPIAWASIRIAATYEPNNYDSLAYHLPRAMYYMGQNTLAHFDTGNPRQIYFPLNYNLLQLFSLIYSPPLQCLNFVNLTAWAVAGLGLFRLCRLSALGANSALIATWLALTSTQILAQATATTNDLPTGAGLLCALVFAWRWRQSRQTRDALLGGLAAGLTAGSKLTVVFFGPAAVLILLVLGWQHWRRGEIRLFFGGVRAWLVPGLLAFVFASPFALINLAEKGEWINKTYDFTLNRPFSLGCVAQTSRAYLVQLFLEPIHRFTFDLEFTHQLNLWGRQAFFPHWNEAYAFSPLYLFPPDLNEDHVWFGFTGPLILLGGVFCLLRGRRLSAPAVWLAAAGLGWFATYFLLNKWSLYNQRYFVPAMLVLSPCLAALVEAGWTSPGFRRSTRAIIATLAVSSVWLAGIYLVKNTSRPYAPLWAGDPAPPALPALPPLMVQRLSTPPKVNIDSTDGNERIFLLMALGRHQRFTAFSATQPDAYNVYSQWGFPRKVAYSNIEQLSSYTVVEVPTKRTAGVEFLGTIGSGQPALDYYGLAAHPENEPATAGNRNILVHLSYGPRDPGRYARLGIKVAGLNAPDRARLTVGIDYEDGTSEELAAFLSTGEAQASVTRPFRRFTVKVRAQSNDALLGSIDLPYLVREESDEIEAPQDPMLLFAEQLIAKEASRTVKTEGLAAPEGPYPQWDLPLIRWAKSPVVRLEIPARPHLGAINLSFELRLHAREAALIDVVHNGEIVKHYQWEGSTRWLIQTLALTPKSGVNVIEFRNVSLGTEPDWMDYLARYPDVKDYLVAQGRPLAEGARWHYENHGKGEGRTLFLQRETVKIPGEDQLYYLFRSLRVEGLRPR